MKKLIKEKERKQEEYEREFLKGGKMLEEIGLYYVGKIEGNNIEKMMKVMKNVRDKKKGKVMINVVKKKGKGYEKEEDEEEKYKGVKKLEVIKGKKEKKKENEKR